MEKTTLQEEPEASMQKVELTLQGEGRGPHAQAQELKTPSSSAIMAFNYDSLVPDLRDGRDYRADEGRKMVGSKLEAMFSCCDCAAIFDQDEDWIKPQVQQQVQQQQQQDGNNRARGPVPPSLVNKQSASPLSDEELKQNQGASTPTNKTIHV